MIKSKFIFGIIDLLLDTDSNENQLRKQVHFLEESTYDYTGAGIFVSFNKLNGISEFRITDDTLIINGVKIESSELSIGADASLFINEGLIDFLEIRSYSSKYPRHELKDYILTQIWENSPGKKVIETP